MRMVATPAFVVLAIIYRMTDIAAVTSMNVLWVWTVAIKFVPTQMEAMCALVTLAITW